MTHAMPENDRPLSPRPLRPRPEALRGISEHVANPIANQSATREAEATPATVPLAGRGVVRGHVVAAVGVLRGRLAEPWTLNALADEVHLSRSQLVRSFDAATGLSPMAYLRQMRVERMARLLVSTDCWLAKLPARSGGRTSFTPASASTPTTASRPPSSADSTPRLRWTEPGQDQDVTCPRAPSTNSESPTAQ